MQLLNQVRTEVRYSNNKKSNPALRGLTLVVAAFLFIVLPPPEFILQLRNSFVQAGVAKLPSNFHMAELRIWRLAQNSKAFGRLRASIRPNGYPRCRLIS